MKRIAVVVIALAMGVGSLAVSAEAKLFLVNALTWGGDYQVHSDVSYGNDARQRLDIYVPASAVSRATPVLVFIPGGCWGACETLPRSDYRFVADSFVRHGYPVVIVDYRLYPEHLFPDIISDVQQALTWVGQHGQDYGIGPELVVMGHSAGAHMAALLVLDRHYLAPALRKQVAGFVGLAGPYDFLPFTKDYQPRLFGPESRYQESQPIAFVNGDDPPMLLLYGTSDTSVKPRNIISLSHKLMEKGDTFQAHCYDGIDHSGLVAALSLPLRALQPVHDDILQFLEEVQQHNVHTDSRLPECGIQITG